MKLGMIGLGKMGGNMAARLMRAGHEIIGTDLDAAAVERLVGEGGEGAPGLPELTAGVPAPRAIWMMVPAGRVVDQTIEALLPDLGEDDVLIDGGNSNYRDTLRRAEMLRERGLHLVDVGTSGGIWGREHGYSLMIGGDAAVVERLQPVFEALAPTPETGWGHVGPSGAGHFVKMVHNGIEYALMQAYGEGFELLRHKKELALDLHQVAEVWRAGSVVRSWLLDLIAAALEEDPHLERVAPFVPDSGEGRWTVHEAVESAVSTPVIALSLMARFKSRDEEGFAERLLSAMRHQFGGHAVRKAAGE